MVGRISRENSRPPYLGGETEYLMAKAAVNLLESNADLENYFREQYGLFQETN